MSKQLGLIAAVLLPLWNIPLMVRVGRRKSSRDVSVWWALGVFGCLLAMLPAGLASGDVVFRTCSLVNVVLFSLVVIQTLRCREGQSAEQGHRVLQPRHSLIGRSAPPAPGRAPIF